MVLGIVAMAIPMTLMTLALEDLPVSLSGVLIALIPLSTIAAAHFIVPGERFQTRSLPGLLIALIGSAVLVGIGGETVDGVGNLWRGVGWMVIGVTMAGVGGALSRRFALEVPSDQLVLPQFTVNTVVLLVVTPIIFEIDVASVDGASWGPHRRGWRPGHHAGFCLLPGGGRHEPGIAASTNRLRGTCCGRDLRRPINR